MEKDDEVKGSGNSYDYGARIYDSRLGRWLSLDPLTSKYPGISPYAFTLDNPVFYYDVDGRDVGAGFKIKNNSSSAIKLTGDGVIYKVANDGTKSKIHGESEKWPGGKGNDDKIGSFTLNSGDSYEPVKVTHSDKKGNVTEIAYMGKITRKDGSVEWTDVHDVDFIDVEKGQTFEVDGKDVTSENTEESKDGYETNGKKNNGEIKIRETTIKAFTKGEGDIAGEIKIENKDNKKDGKLVIVDKNDDATITTGEKKTTKTP